MRRFVPDRGDVVWIDLNPQVGYEQAGRRPALTVSPAGYNGKVGLAVFCPITSQIKGYPFEVVIPKTSKIQGVVLSDQVKNLDWHARNTQLICRLPDEVTREVLAKLNTLVH